SKMVEQRKQLRRGFQRIETRVRSSGVSRAAAHFNFEMKASVVSHRNAIRKAGSDRVVRLGQPELNQACWTDEAPRLLIIREMKLDRSARWARHFLERLQCE